MGLLVLVKAVSQRLRLSSLFVPERTDSPDGGSRAGQSGDSPGAH